MLCLVSLSLRQQLRRSIHQANSTSSIMGPKVSLSMTPCPVEETSAFCTSSASATGAFSVMGHIKWWETRVKNSVNVASCRFLKWTPLCGARWLTKRSQLQQKEKISIYSLSGEEQTSQCVWNKFCFTPHFIFWLCKLWPEFSGYILRVEESESGMARLWCALHYTHFWSH